MASGDDDLKVKLFRDPDKADICGTILHIDDDDWASYGHKFSEHNQVEVKKSLCSRKVKEHSVIMHLPLFLHVQFSSFEQSSHSKLT